MRERNVKKFCWTDQLLSDLGHNGRMGTYPLLATVQYSRADFLGFFSITVRYRKLLYRENRGLK
jgi:hypothetical protein